MSAVKLAETNYTSKFELIRADGERQLRRLIETPIPEVCPKCGGKYYIRDWDGIPQCLNCWEILY